MGLNPRFVPEPVTLTTLKLLGEAGAGPDPVSCAAALTGPAASWA